MGTNRKRKASEAIAPRLLAIGMDIEAIVKVTGLEKEQILEFKE